MKKIESARRRRRGASAEVRAEPITYAGDGGDEAHARSRARDSEARGAGDEDAQSTSHSLFLL